MKIIVMAAAAACGALLVSAGCALRQISASADREVYGIIEAKRDAASGETLPGEALAEKAAPEETVPLGLREALVFAAANNRTYQSRREDVYLNILDLTYQRQQYRTQYGLRAGAGVQGGEDAEDTLSGRFNARLARWLSTGAEITLDITQNFLRHLTGDRSVDLHTIISMNLVQPLLRGAGREIAQEGLVQAEREAVYAIRSFSRYQKDFSVEVTDRYLNMLLLGSRRENFRNNYESLKRTRERVEMLAEAGRVPSMQVDQARQNEFSAYQRWITAANRYEAALDSFKIHLGLSPETRVNLEEAMLDRFIASGIADMEIELEKFIGEALKKRLDLITQHDRLEDANRKLLVAADRLRPELNLSAGARARTEGDSSASLDFRDPSYSAGLELDIPVGRVSERNQYMRALISLERAEREFANKVDLVRLEVIQQYRNLEEARQSYLIQKRSLDLARQRIESVELLLEAGRATIRDLLEAEESYLSAQNELSASIINHTMAHLRFLFSSEHLEVGEEGVWEGGLYEKVVKDI